MKTKPCRQEVVEFVGAEGNRLVATLYRGDRDSDPDKPPILLMHGGGQTRHSLAGGCETVRPNAAIWRLLSMPEDMGTVNG